MVVFFLPSQCFKVKTSCLTGFGIGCENGDGSFFICRKMYQHPVFRVMGDNVGAAFVLPNMYFFNETNILQIKESILCLIKEMLRYLWSDYFMFLCTTLH